MAKQYLMPYTNLHELNLDWLINAMKQLEASWEGAEMKVTASASATAGTPTVKVSGNLKDTLNFDFGLPEGNSYPSDTVPKADNGSGLVGVEATFARGDHVHPSDATKLDKVTYSDETALYAVMNDKQITLPYSGFATSLEVESIENNISRIQASLDQKQDTLVSGSNIKTINNYSLLGSDNIRTGVASVIWANANTESEFAKQTITLSSNYYKLYVVIIRIFSTATPISSYFVVPDQYYALTYNGTSSKYERYITISNSGEVSITDCTYKSESGTSTSNSALIPAIIYGIE